MSLTSLFRPLALLIFICCFAGWSSSIQAQLPTLDWALNTGSTATDIGKAVVIDAQGFAYNGGTHQATADLDPGAGTVSAPGPGLHIQKLDAQGNFVWGMNFVSTNSADLYDLELASNGDLLAVGIFGGTVDFDPGAGTSNLTAQGTTDVFLLRLTANGGFVWAKNIVSGSTANEVPRAMSIDGQGRIVVGGWFAADADFDPSANSNLQYSAGGLDAFLAQYDGSGNLLWVKPVGNTGSDAVLDLTLDANDNITAIGKFGSTADFDPGNGIANLTAAGTFDGFIWRLDAAGMFVFAQPLTTAANDYCSPNSITTDAGGDLVIAGTFFGYVDLDPGPGVANTPTTGLSDMFVLKIDAGGNYLWSWGFGGQYQDGLYSVATDINNNVYVASVYEGTVDFEPGPGVTSATAITYKDIAVVKFSSTGNFGWAALAGGAQNDFINQMRMSPQNDLYVTGSFIWNADFDPNGTFALNAVGASDAYLYRLSFCQQTSNFTITDTTCDQFDLNGTLYNATGTYTQVLTTAQGCDSIITLNLTVNPLTANAVANANTVTASPSGANYQWLDCNNAFAPIPGATTQTFTPPTSGNYAAVVTQGACSDTSACVDVTVVGVDARVNADMQLFPNPATGSVYLHSNIALGDILITNALGQIMLQMHLDASEVLLDLQTWPKAVYFVQVSGHVMRLLVD